MESPKDWLSTGAVINIFFLFMFSTFYLSENFEYFLLPPWIWSMLYVNREIFSRCPSLALTSFSVDSLKFIMKINLHRSIFEDEDCKTDMQMIKETRCGSNRNRMDSRPRSVTSNSCPLHTCTLTTHKKKKDKNIWVRN